MTNTVVIVGAGPSGLTLATILAQQGIDVVILDKKPGVAQQSRAAIIHIRTLELLDKIGLTKKIIAQGLRLHRVQVYAKGRQVADFPLAGEQAKNLTPFPFAISLEQYKTEEILIANLEKLGVKVMWNTEFVALEEDHRGIITRHKDGTEQRLAARWIVGADGASSPVRQALKFGFTGKTYELTGFLADVTIDVHAQKPDPGALHLNLVAGGFVGMLGLTSGQYRLFGAVPPEMAAKSPQKGPSHEAYASVPLKDIQHWFDHYFFVQAKLQSAAWSSLFRIHSRIADHYASGNVYLIGDAAHIHSPAGGQGMNLGIGDAFNLGWKLALVAKGEAKESLLQSYEAERYAVAKTILHNTDRGFMLEASKNPIGTWIKTHVVPHLLGPVMRLHTVQAAIFKLFSQTWITYHQSPIVGGRTQPPLQPGDRLPLTYMASGNLYELIRDMDHSLLLFTNGQDASTLGSTLDKLLQSYGIPIKVLPVQSQTPKTLIMLVRPDGYIGYIGEGDDLSAFQKYMDSVYISK